MLVMERKDHQSVEFIPTVVKGDLARVIVEEITRGASQQELNVLHQALTNRVRRVNPDAKGGKLFV